MVHSRRWFRWMLVVSLTMNLLLLGFFGGLWLRGGPAGTGGPGLVSYARALPEEHRRVLFQEIRESQRAWQGEREGFRAAEEDLRFALRAEPFEPGRVAAALARQRAAQDALAARAAKLLVQQLERMTPAERMDFAERIGERRGSGPGGPRP